MAGRAAVERCGSKSPPFLHSSKDSSWNTRKELLSVPLSPLVASPFNVRRCAGQVEELAALIDSEGLFQNLVVTEHVGRRGRKPVGNNELRAAALVWMTR